MGEQTAFAIVGEKELEMCRENRREDRDIAP
jgi:hypothetical protein